MLNFLSITERRVHNDDVEQARGDPSKEIDVVDLVCGKALDERLVHLDGMHLAERVAQRVYDPPASG